jgi:PTS system cellobiose-specific IIB component
MDTILIVCAAGASSTFLASRMRAIASARGFPITVEAISQPDLSARLPGARALLVGPHLSSAFELIARSAGDHGVVAALLPATAFGPRGADDAIEMLAALLDSRELVSGAPSAGRSSTPSETEGNTHG